MCPHPLNIVQRFLSATSVLNFFKISAYQRPFPLSLSVTILSYLQKDYSCETAVAQNYPERFARTLTISLKYKKINQVYKL